MMDEKTYQNVKFNINNILDIDLEFYKEKQMNRRLETWLTRTKFETWAEYFKVLKQEKTEVSKFKSYITINVTSFFRDTDHWDKLEANVLPLLIEQVSGSSTGLNIWSAGCSIGAEPYTLSMILSEKYPGKKHHILGTDLDQEVIDICIAGGPYHENDLKNLSDLQDKKFVKPGGPPYFLNTSKLNNIQFKTQNLLKDKYDLNYDLVVCRNVVIYFTAEAKDELYKKFYDSLKPGGILFLGGTEIISRPQDIGFTNIGGSFYQK